MSFRIDHPPYRWEAAKKLYIEHMRGQGYGGDDWDTAPSMIRQLWLERAEKAELTARRPDRNIEK